MPGLLDKTVVKIWPLIGRVMMKQFG
ncbi:uncharacterized protein METZ01_LOCUS28811 [marine metagenome]|uniref:Uncharacterized protein n=1 Tax=marine metagenome TaxID=408172 RepID=A0A381QD07_9ZZZZ